MPCPPGPRFPPRAASWPGGASMSLVKQGGTVREVFQPGRREGRLLGVLARAG
jgi:hypothetical protein